MLGFQTIKLNYKKWDLSFLLELAARRDISVILELEPWVMLAGN